MLISWFNALSRLYYRWRYQPGATHRHFVARDIRRDVVVIDPSEIDKGFMIAKVRTWNVLYAYRGIQTELDFGEPRRVALKTLWAWNGPPWGGPVPDEEV